MVVYWLGRMLPVWVAPSLGYEGGSSGELLEKTSPVLVVGAGFPDALKISPGPPGDGKSPGVSPEKTSPVPTESSNPLLAKTSPGVSGSGVSSTGSLETKPNGLTPPGPVGPGGGGDGWYPADEP